MSFQVKHPLLEVSKRKKYQTVTRSPWIEVITDRHWIRTAIFQFVFISCLSLYLACWISLELATLDPFKPRFIRGNNSNPALDFRPRPRNPLSTLIYFKHGGSGNWHSHVKNLLDFFKEYRFGAKLGSGIKCTWTTRIDDHTRCMVPKRKLIDFTTDYACSGPEKFGYLRGHPCVLLKVNKIIGWEPEPYYNVTEVMNHETMPKWLKTKIETVWREFCQGKGSALELECPQLRRVWVSCEGETSMDVEYLGAVSYTPSPSFKGAYFPFLGQLNYKSPLLWVQFRDLTPGVVVSVRCKLWARNIRHDKNNPRIGGVKFELLMD